MVEQIVAFLHTPVGQITLLVFAVLGGGGIVALGWAYKLARLGAQPIARIVTSLNERYKNYQLRAATSSDLERLHNFVRTNTEEGVASLESWQQRYAKNRDAFWIVEHVRDSG